MTIRGTLSLSINQAQRALDETLRRRRHDAHAEPAQGPVRARRGHERARWAGCCNVVPGTDVGCSRRAPVWRLSVEHAAEPRYDALSGAQQRTR